jgi:hypothetical protein
MVSQLTTGRKNNFNSCLEIDNMLITLKKIIDTLI